MKQDPLHQEPKSWRDVIKVHPAADVFPMMPEDELRKLGQDIKEHGLHENITLWSAAPPPINGDDSIYVLDGRNRIAAMELVGILDIVESPTGLSYPGTKGRAFFNEQADLVCYDDPSAYVISKNIHRRHLTKEQQAEFIVKVRMAAWSKDDLAKTARSFSQSGKRGGSTKDALKEKVVEGRQKQRHRKTDGREGDRQCSRTDACHEEKANRRPPQFKNTVSVA
jgi:hypothetical protein